MKREATAIWNGNISVGVGNLTTQSKTLNQTPYSFVSRFEQGSGTNPEELLAAAHAGCFTMKLSLDLGKAGFEPEILSTTAVIALENGKIIQSKLSLKAKVANISTEEFLKIAQNAKETCPVSLAFNLAILLDVELI